MDTLDLPVSAAPVALLSSAKVRVVVQPSPFRASSYDLVFTWGVSLLEILLATPLARVADDGAVELAGDVVITVGSEEIYQKHWHVCRPNPSALVCIHLVPGNTRQAILIGGIVAVVALSALTYGAATGPAGTALFGATGAVAVGTAASAAVSVGGYYALNTFLPYEEPESGFDNAQDSNSVTASSNRLERYAPVPVIAGSIRVTPRLGSAVYTEPVGTDLYLRMMLFVGQGPLEITDIKVGDTDIDDLSGEIEHEVREGRASEDPLTLFVNDPVEINPASLLGELTAAGGPQIQTTALDTTEISVDITFPGGIFHQGKQNRDAYTVVYTVEISPTGADTWTDFVTGSATLSPHAERHETSNLIRANHRRVIAAGQYDIRFTRTNGDGGTSNPSASFWTALRSFQSNDPRPDNTIAAIALRVKRTGSSTVPPISCLTTSYALDWNGAAWLEATTNNPASLGRHLLQGSPQINPVADGRMDLPSWQAFHDFCETEGFTFNGVFEDERDTLDRLKAVLAAGRGRLVLPDGKYAVAIDQAGKSIVGSITPRNSFDFRGVHTLAERLDGFRCLFYNQDKDFQPDERLVFRDGVTEGTADYGKVEVLDLTTRGITDPDYVWREGRYRLAERELRPGIYSVKQGKRAKKYVPGDLVAFQSDIPLFGLGGGRIKSVTTDMSGNVTGVSIDADVTMEVATTYEARVTFVDDSDVDQFMVRAVDTVPGTTRDLTFTTPFPAGTVPAIGDELAFGETNLATVNCIVRDVFPGPEDTAEIVLIDEAPAIFTSDTGPIPAWNSQITLPFDFFGTPPATPVIEDVVIHNIAHPAQPDLITTQKLIVHLQALGSFAQPQTGYDLEIKRDDQQVYQRRYHYPSDASELEVQIVESNVLYNIRVRATGRSPRGIPNESPWSTVFSIYVPLPSVTAATTARVAHLELQGQGDNTMFQGPDAHFTWSITAISGAFQLHGGQGQLIGFIDPQFAWYEVKVIDPVTAYVRRIVNTTTPDFIYPISDNKEDSRKQAAVLGGSSRPLRRFTVQVTFVDRFGRRGPGRSLTVENPAPAAPSGLIVSGQVSALFVKAQTPTDDDFEKLIVYIGATTGFDPAAPTTQVQEALTNFLTIPAAAGTTLYVRVALADRFSDDIADLNLSSEIGVPIESPDGPPRFTVEGIEFLPILATNTVQWTSGAVFVQDGATVTEEAVAAGTAVWTSGTLWLYYVRASGVIQATTNAALAQQPDRIALAQYRGGNRLTRTTGDFIPANIVSVGAGPTSSPGKNSSSLLLVLDPITTSGNPVVIRASAAANMTANSVGAVQSGFLQIRRDGAVLQQVKIMEAARPETLSHNSDFWAGGFDIEDNQAAGTYIYELWAANSINNSSLDSNTSYRGLSLTAQEVAY